MVGEKVLRLLSMPKSSEYFMNFGSSGFGSISPAVVLGVRELRKTHALGRRSLKEHGETLYKTPKVLAEFAKENGLQPNLVRLARQFAHEFSQADLELLCRECQKHEFKLGTTLLFRSFAVRPHKKRLAILRRVIREKWTQRQLNAAVAELSDAAPRRGRPRILADNRASLRRQVNLRILPALRWLKEMKDADLELLKGDEFNKAITSLEKLVNAVVTKR